MIAPASGFRCLWLACLMLAACSNSEKTEEKTAKVGVEVGNIAPDFRVKNLRGGATTLSEYRGRVVLINFWATWCEPCRTEMPSMEALYRSQLQHDFEILAVSIDTSGAPPVRLYIEQFGFTFPVLMDDHFQVNDLYQVRVVPTSILIDRRGRVAERIPGAKDWNNPDMRAHIERLIRGFSPPRSGVEGEAHRALPDEGATRAPEN